ncbi:unnamed protein product, partial [Didymodactylos carnosus]
MLAGTDILDFPENSHYQVNFSCQYIGGPIWIFAVKIHTHRQGRLASLYRVRKRSIGPNQVQLIFKGNPQEFQSFNKLPLKIFVGDTDYLIGKCVYDNDDGSNIRER